MQVTYNKSNFLATYCSFFSFKHHRSEPYLCFFDTITADHGLYGNTDTSNKLLACTKTQTVFPYHSAWHPTPKTATEPLHSQPRNAHRAIVYNCIIPQSRAQSPNFPGFLYHRGWRGVLIWKRTMFGSTKPQPHSGYLNTANTAPNDRSPIICQMTLCGTNYRGIYF